MNMKKIICSITMSLALVAPAMAQEAASTSVEESTQAAREAVREEIKNMREGAKKAVADLRTERAEKRAQFKKELAEAQDALRKRVQEKKDELKKNLVKIKDEKKRTIVENVYEQMTKLSETRTARFADALEKLEAVAERIKARAEQAKAAGRDIAAVEAALVEAVKAIDAAGLVVKAQAGQIYKIGVDGEATLKTKVGNVRKVLHEDLKKAEDAVKAAREKMHAAAVALGATETPASAAATTTQQ